MSSLKIILLQWYQSGPSIIQELLVKGRTFKIKVLQKYALCFCNAQEHVAVPEEYLHKFTISNTYIFLHVPSQHQHKHLLQTYNPWTHFLASEQTPNSIMKLQVKSCRNPRYSIFSVLYSSTVHVSVENIVLFDTVVYAMYFQVQILWTRCMLTKRWQSHVIYPAKDKAKNKVGLEGKTVKSPSRDMCSLQRMCLVTGYTLWP